MKISVGGGKLVRWTCYYAYRKLDPHVLVMQSTKDHAGKYATNGPDGAPISLSAVLSLNHNNFG
jgi:hypothetical protein